MLHVHPCSSGCSTSIDGTQPCFPTVPAILIVSFTMKGSTLSVGRSFHAPDAVNKKAVDRPGTDRLTLRGEGQGSQKLSSPRRNSFVLSCCCTVFCFFLENLVFSSAFSFLSSLSFTHNLVSCSTTLL